MIAGTHRPRPIVRGVVSWKGDCSRFAARSRPGRRCRRSRGSRPGTGRRDRHRHPDGLPAGTGFQRDALNAGEAVIVTSPTGEAIGLVPEFEYDDGDDGLADENRPPELCQLSWTVYSVPATPLLDQMDLGEAEYALRAAVRSAAEALGAMRLGAAGGVDDPRGLVEQVLESSRHHRAPDHAPTRALRVLENAAHVDAIPHPDPTRLFSSTTVPSSSGRRR